MEESYLVLEDNESIFSASAKLEIDGGAGQLAYNPQPEIDHDAKNIFWQQEFLDWSVRADIKAICQGQHNGGASACLLILRFVLSLESAGGGDAYPKQELT
jgi:hypothetical protein